MRDDRSAFWTDRLRALGHTGWGDPFLHLYDQGERLAIMEAIIARETIGRDAALDFGCGVGDFSKLLLKMGFRVCGYDPFVQPPIRSENFSYARTYAELPPAGTVDLALSVTALDHILDDNDLREALGHIRDCLKDAGILYMFEYALDATSDRDMFDLRNDYQSFRTIPEWTGFLNQAAFQVLDITPMPHPVLNPSQGFRAFGQSPLIGIRLRFPKVPLVTRALNYLLRQNAARLRQQYPPQNSFAGPSPLKLIRCRPVPRTFTPSPASSSENDL